VIAQIIFIWVAGIVSFILFFSHAYPLTDEYYALLLVIILGFSITGPGGDLLESYFKRRAGVKDTADYIPGH
jgi:phosphatidate cytidylyltransferase